MRNKGFEDSLLEIKKAKFLEFVNRAAKSLDVPRPKIQFWERDCPEYSGKERAHIHIEQNVICISEIDLKNMTYEDIEECATHEVTHLTDKHPEIDHVHSPDFYKRHDNVKANIWRPPGGVVFIDGGRTPKHDNPQIKKSKPDKIHCNNCGKKEELDRCKYCERYFCGECNKPFEPYVGHPSNRPIWYEKAHGHPCPDYYEFHHLKKKKHLEESEITKHPIESTFKGTLIKETYSEDYKHTVVKKESKTLQDRILKRLNRKQRKEEYKRIKREEADMRRQIEEQKRIEQQKIAQQRKEEAIKRHELKEKQRIAEQEKIKRDLEEYKDKVQGIVDKTRKPVEEKRSPSYKHTIVNRQKNIKIIIALGLIISIVLSLIFLLNRNTTPAVEIADLKETKTNTTEAISESVPVKILFSEYLNNKEKYENKPVTLTGFLRYKLEGTDNVGVYVELIVDDYGSEIKLQNIPKEYRKLFVPKETTKELFNVTGIFQRKYQSAEIEVSKIVSTERQMQIK